MNDIKHKLVRMVPAVTVVLSIVIAVMLVYWLKSWLGDKPADQKKIVQQVTLIMPPPPPPAPPEEKPPEPEVEEKIEQPEEQLAEDMPEESAEPAGSELGVDAEGTGSGDGFGLIGKKGGRGLLSGSPFAWYVGLMEREMTDLLSTLEDLKEDSYTVQIKLWLAIDGKIERIELDKSTGDKKKDQDVLLALNSLREFSQMPPGKMPQPVHLKITSSI